MDSIAAALIVDDDSCIRRALSEELRTRCDPIRVFELGSGPDASTCLTTVRPDLLFLDLLAAGQIDFQAYRATPPILVLLSTDDCESVHALRHAGLSAWMKPEVFAHLPRILQWAESVRRQPDRLCEQWVLALSRFGAERGRDCTRVLAWDYQEQTLVNCCEILAVRRCGSMSRLTLSDSSVVLSPHKFEFLIRQLRERGFLQLGTDLLINRACVQRMVSQWFRAVFRRPFRMCACRNSRTSS